MEPKISQKKIYDELKKIQKSNSNISQIGKTYKKLFQKKCIKSFLDRRIAINRVKQQQRKIELESKGLIPSKTHKKEIWRKIFSLSHSFIESSKPLSEFNDLIKYHDKTEESKAQKVSKFESHQKSIEAHNKFQPRPDLYIHLKRLKGRAPHAWHYNPSYSYISPHVYVPRINPIASKSGLNKTQIDIKEGEPSLGDQYSLLPKKTNNNTIKSGISNANHTLSFENYLNRNLQLNKCYYKDSEINPSKIYKHIPSPPDFKKMTSREKKTLHPKMPVIVNYYPIYDSIEDKLFMSKKATTIKLSLQRQMKQICSSYDVTRDYISVPSMNQ